MTEIEKTKARIAELEAEARRLQAQPCLFADFRSAHNSDLGRNLRSLQGQRRKLTRLERQHG